MDRYAIWACIVTIYNWTERNLLQMLKETQTELQKLQLLTNMAVYLRQNWLV